MGAPVDSLVGAAVVGALVVGASVGCLVGDLVGARVGPVVGWLVGGGAVGGGAGAAATLIGVEEMYHVEYCFTCREAHSERVHAPLKDACSVLRNHVLFVL